MFKVYICMVYTLTWCCNPSYFCQNVKLSFYKPGQTLRVPVVWGSQISRQSAHEYGKVVGPTHQPPLPPRKYLWYSFLLEAEATPGSDFGWKDYVNKKFQWHYRESNPRPPGSTHCATTCHQFYRSCINRQMREVHVAKLCDVHHVGPSWQHRKNLWNVNISVTSRQICTVRLVTSER
jgi:hypothetical protein